MKLVLPRLTNNNNSYNKIYGSPKTKQMNYRSTYLQPTLLPTTTKIYGSTKNKGFIDRKIGEALAIDRKMDKHRSKETRSKISPSEKRHGSPAMRPRERSRPSETLGLFEMEMVMAMQLKPSEWVYIEINAQLCRLESLSSPLDLLIGRFKKWRDLDRRFESCDSCDATSDYTFRGPHEMRHFGLGPYFYYY